MKDRCKDELTHIPTIYEDYWFNALEDIEDADTNIVTRGFTDYVTSYWVEVNRNLWNNYATKGSRTTNHLEGWHGKLKKVVKTPHPNIYSIIQLLKMKKPSKHEEVQRYRQQTSNTEDQTSRG